MAVIESIRCYFDSHSRLRFIAWAALHTLAAIAMVLISIVGFAALAMVIAFIVVTIALLLTGSDPTPANFDTAADVVRIAVLAGGLIGLIVMGKHLLSLASGRDERDRDVRIHSVVSRAVVADGLFGTVERIRVGLIGGAFMSTTYPISAHAWQDQPEARELTVLLGDSTLAGHGVVPRAGRKRILELADQLVVRSALNGGPLLDRDELIHISAEKARSILAEVGVKRFDAIAAELSAAGTIRGEFLEQLLSVDLDPKPDDDEIFEQPPADSVA